MRAPPDTPKAEIWGGNPPPRFPISKPSRGATVSIEGKIMMQPVIRFSSYNLPRENGGATYAITWRGEHTGRLPVTVGYLSRTRRGTWQVDIAGHWAGRPIIKETARFADAKRMARELLA